MFVSVFDLAPALSELKNTKNDNDKKQAVISDIMGFPGKGHGAFKYLSIPDAGGRYLEFFMPVMAHS